MPENTNIDGARAGLAQIVQWGKANGKSSAEIIAAGNAYLSEKGLTVADMRKERKPGWFDRFRRNLETAVGAVGTAAAHGAADVGSVLQLASPDAADTAIGGRVAPVETSDQMFGRGMSAIGATPVEPVTGGAKLAMAGIRGMVGAAPFPIMGAISGVGSEAAGQATQGTSLEPYARVAGGLAAPLGAGALRTGFGTVPGIVQRAMRGVTGQDEAAALRLAAEARAQGIPLTGAEAFGKSSPEMLQIQRVAEDAPVAGRTLGAFMSQRGEQIEAAWKRQEAGVSPEADPRARVQGVQGAAAGRIKGAAQARTQAANPGYAAAAGDKVPKVELNSLVGSIKAAIKTVPRESATAKELRRLARQIKWTRQVPVKGAAPAEPGGPIPTRGVTRYEANVAKLDAIRKEFRDRLKLPDTNSKAIDKQTAAIMRPVLRDMRSLLERASPNYAAGRAAFIRASPEVDRVVRGPIGELAGSVGKTPNAATSLERQVAAIADPKTATPASIARVAADLNQVSPEAYPALVRGVLSSRFADASRNVSKAAQSFVGARLANRLLGNNAANTEALISALPNGAARWAGFRSLLNVLEATGGRLPAGSPTQVRQATQRTLESGSMMSMRGASDLLRRLRTWHQDFLYGRNSAALARILTADDSVDRLIALRRLAPGSVAARALAASLILGAEKATQPTPPSPK